MLSRRSLAAGLALGLVPSVSWARRYPPIGPLGDSPPEQPADIRSGVDRDDRMTIPVTIGGQGPFHFVVDTGADRSVVADDVAGRLGYAPGPMILVHGIAGAEMTATVQAPTLMVGDLRLKGGNLPVTPRSRLGVDGMLGVDMLQNRRLVMDFKERTLRIGPSADFEHALKGQETVMRAMKRFGRLAVVDANADDVDVTAFVDTGAAISIGNMALETRLRAGKDGMPPEQATINLYGVTADTVTGSVRRVRRLSVGRLDFNDMPLVFCDLHLFELWGLSRTPAVLLGMDLMQRFASVELDYGQRAMRFRLAENDLTPTGFQIARA